MCNTTPDSSVTRGMTANVWSGISLANGFSGCDDTVPTACQFGSCTARTRQGNPSGFFNIPHSKLQQPAVLALPVRNACDGKKSLKCTYYTSSVHWQIHVYPYSRYRMCSRREEWSLRRRKSGVSITLWGVITLVLSAACRRPLDEARQDNDVLLGICLARMMPSICQTSTITLCPDWFFEVSAQALILLTLLPKFPAMPETRLRASLRVLPVRHRLGLFSPTWRHNHCFAQNGVTIRFLP